MALLLAIVTLLACKSEKAPEIISEQSPFGDFYMTVDTLSIPITEKQHFIYPQFGTVNENDSLYLFGYNVHRHTIDVFNLTGKKYTSTIPLERQGPNGIPELISFAPASLDSVYIMSTYQISLVNQLGTVKDKVMINLPTSPIKSHNSDEAFFWIEKNESIHYSKKHNTLYGLYHSMEYDMCDKRRYKEEELISGIDLNKNQMLRLPAAYPIDKRNDSYGFASSLYMSWDGDSLIYNFRHDPNIYIYDLNRDKTDIFDGRSRYTKNSANPINWSQCDDVSLKMDHSMISVNFERIIRDPYRKLSYRFHRKELPENGNVQDYIFSDKKLFISIFDNGMAKTGEMIIDSRPYPSHVSFAGKDGLYVSAPSGENTLSFHVFKVYLTEGDRNQYEFINN